MAKKTVKKTATKKTAPVKKKAAKKVSKKTSVTAVKKSTSINPYLTFAGNCETAFNFYKSIFGGKFTFMGKFKDMPPMEGKPLPKSEGEKIMHVSLPIGTDSVLMGSDSSDAFGQATVIGNNYSISINAKSKAEADKLYNGLSASGHATMPMSKTFWGAYFGMLTDKFGIQWMVNFDSAPQK